MASIAQDLSTEEDNIDDNPDSSANLVFSDDEHECTYIVEDGLHIHKQQAETLANIALMHGRTFSSDLKMEIAAMNAELREGEQTNFIGIHIATCENRSSVMSLSQYKAYCEEFNVPCQIDRTQTKPIRGIGGNSTLIGTVTIPVPFKDLGLILDITFRIVKDNVPSLLSNKDMIDNGLGISLQNKVITYGVLK